MGDLEILLVSFFFCARGMHLMVVLLCLFCWWSKFTFTLPKAISRLPVFALFSDVFPSFYILLWSDCTTVVFACTTAMPKGIDIMPCRINKKISENILKSQYSKHFLAFPYCFQDLKGVFFTFLAPSEHSPTILLN